LIWFCFIDLWWKWWRRGISCCNSKAVSSIFCEQWIQTYFFLIVLLMSLWRAGFENEYPGKRTLSFVHILFKKSVKNKTKNIAWNFYAQEKKKQ
jgi:hypothetical protein